MGPERERRLLIDYQLMGKTYWITEIPPQIVELIEN